MEDFRKLIIAEHNKPFGRDIAKLRNAARDLFNEDNFMPKNCSLKLEDTFWQKLFTTNVDDPNDLDYDLSDVGFLESAFAFIVLTNNMDKSRLQCTILDNLPRKQLSRAAAVNLAVLFQEFWRYGYNSVADLDSHRMNKLLNFLVPDASEFLRIATKLVCPFDTDDKGEKLFAYYSPNDKLRLILDAM